jgi:hypothetical protein
MTYDKVILGLERARWPAELPSSGWDYGTEQGLPEGGRRVVAERI